MIMQKDRSFLSVREKGKSKEDKKEKRALGSSSLVDMDNLGQVPVGKKKEDKKGLFGMFKAGNKKGDVIGRAGPAESGPPKSKPSHSNGSRCESPMVAQM